MRIIVILFFTTLLFGGSYNFSESKYIAAADVAFGKSGKISFDDKKTVITYDKPQYKQIILKDGNISIEGSSGKVVYLKGKALFFTKMYITTMTRIDNVAALKTNRDFSVKKEGDLYILEFKGEISEQILKAEVQTKNSRVIRFKLFMRNGDTLEIVKK
ncbi:hypothetical protein MNB_SM-6-1416 [hydrothermal vent metagenome]|uniref:Uncharacterized protein n=1 Tax=hydrothermal vent metagenome TaxID=652676 RepID=A0A1W1C6P7_9ZZZZ